MVKTKLILIWQSLTFREKILATILTTVLVPLAIIFLIILPIINFNDQIYQDHLQYKDKVANFERNLTEYNQLKSKNLTSNFDFEKVFGDITVKSGIIEKPQITKNEQDGFGNQYVIRFNSLRSDQIFLLLYNMENNTPPIIVENFEASESIQQQKFARLTLLIKSE